jgi:DnaJ-class molecular chaperone
MTGHMGLDVALVLIVAGVAFRYGRRLRTHPYARCIWCKGHGGKRPGSKPDAWGSCTHCGGSGRRIRTMTRILGRDKPGEHR